MNEALKTMMKMKIAGIGPHLSTYNSFINGYAKKGKMDEVRNIMKTMELINGYAKNGMMDEARKTLETMQQKEIKPDVATYNPFIHHERYVVDGLRNKQHQQALNKRLTLKGVFRDHWEYVS